MIKKLLALVIILSASCAHAGTEVITDTRAVSDKEVEVTKTVVETVDIAILKRRLANINAQIQRLQDQKTIVKAQIDAAKAIGVDPAETAVDVIK